MESVLFKLKIKLVLFFTFLLICFFLCPNFLFSADNNGPVFPDFTGYINDYAGLLDSGSITDLENLCSKIENETGSEIAVVLVDSLQGITEQEYAVRLFKKWGIGKAGKDNGILILACTEGEEGNRPLWIEVGYGLEGVITDLETGRIVNEIIVPNFSAGNFYTGLHSAIITMADQIYEEEGLESVSSGQDVNKTDTETTSIPVIGFLSGFSYGWICCFPIPFLIIVIVLLVNLFRRRCPRCRKLKLKIKSTVIKAATYTAAGKKLVERVCSNCGYSDKKEVVIPRKSRSSYWGGSGSSGRGSSSSGSGGFGGFGGGSSGGGGAGGKW